MSELKPCPFCGKSSAIRVEQETEEVFFVACYDCCASGPYMPSKQQAIDAWNKRS